MAKRKQSFIESWIDQKVDQYMEKHGDTLFREDGTVHRMLYSTSVSELLKHDHRLIYLLAVVLIILAEMMPMIIYSLILEITGNDSAAGPEAIAWLAGFFSSLIAGIGVANLMMIPLEKLCQRLLRVHFPDGQQCTFYLGHRVTLIFLGGFGGFSALCALICILL